MMREPDCREIAYRDGVEATTSSTERALIVGMARDRRSRPLAEASLEELRELVTSAGATVVDAVLQERAAPDPAYFIGRGKVAELVDRVLAHDADLVVFDEDLSPAQQRNLEEEVGVKVIDRSGLILDIFAQRARSREGKLQVELALLEYTLPRLAGRGRELSRLGGGIGTRGPGETQLETDRRVIRRRIAAIRRELEKLEERRALHRRKRRSVPLPVVSLVGYTNAGKSTLFNRLCGAHTFVSARMFATLDPLVRRARLPSGQEILLSDTVGFIRKLPHTLVTAFHATLEETVEADLLLHVIDASDPQWPELRRTVCRVLEEIGAGDVPVLEVYNKLDRWSAAGEVPSGEGVAVSALTGEGIELLLAELESRISSRYLRVTLVIPFARGDVIPEVRGRGRVQSVSYEADGTKIVADLRPADVGRFREFLVS
ncbi:MAG: GTPase HflX [Acidobacteriota bacterium]